jgi:hypothetical protein
MYTTIVARAAEEATENRRSKTTVCCRALVETLGRASARPAAGQNRAAGDGTYEKFCIGNKARPGRKSAPDSETRTLRTKHT